MDYHWVWVIKNNSASIILQSTKKKQQQQQGLLDDLGVYPVCWLKWKWSVVHETLLESCV